MKKLTKKAKRNKPSASSRRATQRLAKGANSKKGPEFSPLILPDERIDTSDAPEVSLKGGIRGLFFRPTKEMISIRLDADLLDWLRKNEESYQSKINEVLRRYVQQRMLERLRRRR